MDTSVTISIPVCPESFRKDSRHALLAGMTLRIIIHILDAIRSLPKSFLQHITRIEVELISV